jgi:hypothetical protein
MQMAEIGRDGQAVTSQITLEMALAGGLMLDRCLKDQGLMAKPNALGEIAARTFRAMLSAQVPGSSL